MRSGSASSPRDGDVVIEGRDIGTVVAPHAEVKVYPRRRREERARRRKAERPEIGADALATDLRMRDQSDAVRMQPAEDAIVIDTTELEVDDVVDRIEELVRARRRRKAGRRAWVLGRPRSGRRPARHAAARVRHASASRAAAASSLAINHFHWIDIPCVGAASPRDLDFVAKVEAHGVPGLGELIRSFGTIAVRRGESDRDAVRRCARSSATATRSVSSSRERAASGLPGHVQPGAAMVAIQEDVPVICAAIYGSQTGGSGTSSRSRSPGASRCTSTACRAAARATRRRRRDRARLGGSGSGSGVHEGRPRVATPPVRGDTSVTVVTDSEELERSR